MGIFFAKKINEKLKKIIIDLINKLKKKKNRGACIAGEKDWKNLFRAAIFPK